MSHEVKCSKCGRKFAHGVSLVYRLVVFHFCATCWKWEESCRKVMQLVCPELNPTDDHKVVPVPPPGTAAAAKGMRSW
jgi:DNA-directed RNA polymerase subunit RPC12/RpoP